MPDSNVHHGNIMYRVELLILVYFAVVCWCMAKWRAFHKNNEATIEALEKVRTNNSHPSFSCLIPCPICMYAFLPSPSILPV